MIDKKDLTTEDVVPLDLLRPMGWIVVDTETKDVVRRDVGTGTHSRKKSTIYVSKTAAKAQCYNGQQVVEVYAIDDENY